MHLVKRSQGFSLLELTVTLAITGITTVMFMRYTFNSQQQDNHLRFEAQINEALITIQSTINRPEKCSELFKNKTVSASGTDVPGGLTLNGGKLQLLRTGNYADFTVTSIKLADSAMNATSFDLVLQFTPRTSGISSLYPTNRVLTKRLTVVGLKQGGVIRSCGPIVSDTNNIAKATFCSNLGTGLATWNSATQKCTLKPNALGCSDPDKVPTAMSATGVVTCTNIGTKVDMTKIFDFGTKLCPGKKYTIYQANDGRITIGCPTAVQIIDGFTKSLQN